MAQNILELIFKADTKDLKAAKESLSDVKGKFADLTREIPMLGNGLSQIGGAFSSLRGSMTSFTAGLAGVAAGAAAAVVALAALGVAAAIRFQGIIDDLGDLAEKIGLNINQTAILKTALEDAGTSINALQGGADRLARSMAKSGDDTKGAGAAFERLGVATEDANGKLRSTDEVMAELTERYKDANLTAGEQADLALTLGKNYREVMQAYKVAAEATEEYNLAMERGLGITNNASEVSSAYNKSLREASTVANSMGSIFVELVIPALTSLTNWFVKSYSEGGTVAKIFNVIAGATRITVTVISGLVEWLGILVDYFILVGESGMNAFKGIQLALKGDFSGAFDVLNKGLDNYIKGIDTLGRRSVELIKKNAGEVKELMNANYDAVGEAQSRVRSENQRSTRTLGFTGSSGGRATGASEAKAEKDPKEKVSELVRLEEALTRQKVAMEELNKVSIVNAEIERIRQKEGKIDEEAAGRIKLAAAEIDSANARKMLNSATAELNKSADGYIDRLKDEVAQQSMGKREYAEMIELRKLDAQYLREIEKLKEKGLLTSEREAELAAKLAENKSKVQEQTKKSIETDQDWLNGGMNDYLTKIGDVDTAMSNWVTGSLAQVEEGIVSLFTTGDFSFKSLAKSIISSLAQMAVQFLIIKPILEWFKTTMNSIGGGSGGLWGSIGNAFVSMFGAANGAVIGSNFASGGVMRPGPQRFFAGGGMNLANEAGDEAIMPLKRNAAGVLGVEVAGGRAGGAQVVNNNMSVSIGTVDSEERQAALMREISKMIKAGSKETLVQERTRPGGLLYGR